MNKKNTTLPNHKNKPYGGAWSVDDPEQKKYVKSLVENNFNELSNFDTKKFLNKYVEWFPSTHNIKGLETFDSKTCSQGTTETFDKWYQVTKNKRLRIFRGEYFYHQIAAREIYSSWSWLEDGPIHNNDVVVVSCPFADTGNLPAYLDSILQQCNDHQVPVLIDLAYINLATNLSIDLSYNCIKVVTTSLSKVFPVPYHRIGMRLTKGIEDDLMIAYQQNQYVNRFSCGIGYHLMNKFEANDTYIKYRSQQLELCEKLNVEPSSSVLFGVDTQKAYQEYSRGGETNRLCFRKQFIKLY